MEITKADWKLFRDRIGSWQERYMEKLIAEYIEFLGSDALASEKFWGLRTRINEDRKSPGVSLALKKKGVPYDMARLLNEGIITTEDLDGFSDELKERVTMLHEMWMRD